MLNDIIIISCYSKLATDVNISNPLEEVITIMKIQILLICMFLSFCVVIVLPNAVMGQTNIVISAETVRDFGEMSEENVEIVEDEAASNGLAIHFTGGAVAVADLGNPEKVVAWFKVEFFADAAEYFIWIRARTADDADTSVDSDWLQFDDQIGTGQHTADKDAPDRGLGNWRDVFDAGVYAWGSQEVPPASVVSVKFKERGLHTMLMTPRQAPHFIDQILLSQDQDEYPDDEPWAWNPAKDPRVYPVELKDKLTTSWGRLKKSR
jgi:hypothetical protein